MSQKGLLAAENVLAHHRSAVEAIVSATDDAVEKDYFVEIQDLARSHHVPFFERRDFDSATIDPNAWAIAISWRWLIERPHGKLIVLHDSLLPRYRGFNPLVSALVAGDRSIGVTALVATAEFDRGPIISRRAIAVDYPLRIADAISMISKAYVELVDEILVAIENDESLEGTAQNESEATYSLWRDDDDYRLDWTLQAAVLQRTIHAVGFPYKGALSTVDGIGYRLLDAETVADVRIENRAPGKVIWLDQGCPVVVCGEGLLKVTKMVDAGTGLAALPFRRLRVRFR